MASQGVGVQGSREHLPWCRSVWNRSRARTQEQPDEPPTSYVVRPRAEGHDLTRVVPASDTSRPSSWARPGSWTRTLSTAAPLAVTSTSAVGVSMSPIRGKVVVAYGSFTRSVC